MVGEVGKFSEGMVPDGDVVVEKDDIGFMTKCRV